MALHWRPVGPEPAETYWRRRAVVAAVLVLLPVLVLFLLRGGDDSDRLSAAQEEGPASGASESLTAGPPAGPPDPAASSSPGTVEACGPAVVKVSVKADKEEYPVGGRPVLELAVDNAGAAACTLDLGSGAVELLIFSGSDRIWSSDDCASGRAAKPTVLEPAKPEVTRLTWAGRRSLPGCDGPKASAQPGTYRVLGRVGEMQVQGGSFRIVG